MKLPEMPGKIMAQMAMAPQRKMNHSAEGVSAGVMTVMNQAATAPTTNPAMLLTSHRVTSRETNHVDASTSPKKKAHTSTGWWTSR